MAKDAYYFSHDSNASDDPKMISLISTYGLEGYGRFWIVIEMLREQDEYRLDITKKFIIDALAKKLLCSQEEAKNFINACIEDFELLATDGQYIWSNSLNRRMAEKEEKSNQAKKAAVQRWNNKRSSTPQSTDITTSNADAMQMQCECNADAMQLKERKVKESKGKEKKDILSSAPSKTTPYDDIVSLYHSTCPSLPKIQTLTEKRKKTIRTRYQKFNSIEQLEKLFQKAEASDFLSGRNGKWTSCNFDWLMNESNSTKTLEGTYDNKETDERSNGPPAHSFSYAEKQKKQDKYKDIYMS